MITIEKLRRKATDLPPLPDIVVKLLQASRDPEVSMRDMVELIRLDPALTIRVMRLCNSSYYGLPRQINSIQEALVYIGTDTLVNFILAGCLASYFQTSQEGYGLAAGHLWRHSVACAIASAQLCGGDGDSSEAFTAGLLHDIGKIILNTYVASSFEEIMDVVHKKKIPFEAAERDILGFSHTDAGAYIARLWHMPESLIESIAHHHVPENAEFHNRLVCQVHLGNIMCMHFGIGVGKDGLAYAFSPFALDQLGLTVEDLYRISLNVQNDFCEAEELVGLATADAA